MQRSPRLRGRDQRRWTLAALRERWVWRWRLSLGGVGKGLKRLGSTSTRGRRELPSPAPASDQKMAASTAARAAAEAKPEQVGCLSQDELTYDRRPTVAQGAAVAGRDGPRADQGDGRNKQRRSAGWLHARSGACCAWPRASVDRQTLIRCYPAVAAASATAEVI